MVTKPSERTWLSRRWRQRLAGKGPGPRGLLGKALAPEACWERPSVAPSSGHVSDSRLFVRSKRWPLFHYFLHFWYAAYPVFNCNTMCVGVLFFHCWCVPHVLMSRSMINIHVCTNLRLLIMWSVKREAVACGWWPSDCLCQCIVQFWPLVSLCTAQRAPVHAWTEMMPWCRIVWWWK